MKTQIKTQLYYQQVSSSIPSSSILVDFNITEATHKKTLQEKINSLFKEGVVGVVGGVVGGGVGVVGGVVGVVGGVVGGEGEVPEERKAGKLEEKIVTKITTQQKQGILKSLDKESLFKFLSQEIQAEAEAEQKPYHEFLNEFLARPENKVFAFEFLATNHEKTIALMELNNKVVSESNAQLVLLRSLKQYDQIVQNEEQLQNNGIVNLIKNNFNDFLTEFFTVATTKERENLLQKILETKDIDVTNIKTPQEGDDKKRFIKTFLMFFNENLIKEKAITIIKNNLDGFTEELLKIVDFKKEHIELFANSTQELMSKIVVAINTVGEEQAQARTNATAIALNQIAQNEEQLQNNGIVNLIKNNFNDFLTEFFTVATTKERENLLQKILETQDIDVTNIKTPQEGDNKKRFITEFLVIFNKPTTIFAKSPIKEKATTIIKENLNDFTEYLLKEDFKEEHVALFDNASQEAIEKIVATINAAEEGEEQQAKARTNATEIALKNFLVLEKVLQTEDIANKIEIKKETTLNKEVAGKLINLVTQQAENNKQTKNAQALIVKGITAENKTIIKNLTVEAIKNLEPDQIKALGKKENVEILDKAIASDLNNSNNPEVKSLAIKSLAKKIAYQEPENHKDTILKDDFFLSKQLNKTLTGATDSVITKDNFSKIKSSLATQSTILKYDESEITAENQLKMSSIKLALVNATQKSANNNDTEKLKTTLKTASSLIGSTKKLNDGKGKEPNKEITAKDITDSAVYFNRNRLKLLGFHRKVENSAYTGYEVDMDGKKAIEEFKELEIIKNLYQGKGSAFLGKEKDKWTVKLAFIEFMGYKTPEELSFLKIVDKDKDAKSKQDKIEAILKEIETNFGWTLKTGYHGALKANESMKLTYKEPNEQTKKGDIFKNFVQQSIAFLTIAEKAEKEQQNRPEKTLKGSLQVKKAHLNELLSKK